MRYFSLNPISSRIDKRDFGCTLFLLLVTVLLNPSIAFRAEIPLDSDSILFFYPLRALHSDPDVHFWNPYQFSGFPRDANPQSQLLYPPNLVFQIVSTPIGYAALLIGHLWLGGFLMYCLLRRLTLERAAALLGATVFLASAFWRCKITNLGLLEGIAWVPGLLLFYITALERTNDRNSLIASLFFALVILPGVPHTVIYCVVFLFLISFGYGITKKCSWTHVGVNFLSTTGFGILLTAGVWLPAAIYSSETQRVALELQDALAGSLGWSEIWKSFLGGLSQPGILRADPWEGTCYIGITALFLVPFGWKKVHLPLRLGLSLALLFSILYTMGEDGLLFPVLFNYLPGWSFLNLPNRSLFIAAICLPVFSAYGIQSLVSLTENKRTVWAVTTAVSVICATAFFFISGATTDNLLFSALTTTFQRGPISDSAWSLLNALTWLSITAVVYTLYAFKVLRASIIYALLLLFIIVQSAHYSQRLFLQTTPPDYMDKPELLAQLPADGRTAGFSPLIDSHDDVRLDLNRYYSVHRLPDVFRLHEIQGYDPMYPKRYGELIRAWSGTPQNVDSTRIIRLNELPKAMLDFLNVKTVVGYPRQSLVYSGSAALDKPGAIGGKVDPPAVVESVMFRWLLSNAEQIPQGTPVGQVKVMFSEDTVEIFPIRAGIEIANYITQMDGRYISHRAANVFRWFPMPAAPGYSRVQQYFQIYTLQQPREIDLVLVESFLPNINLVILQMNAHHADSAGLELVTDEFELPLYYNPDADYPVYIAKSVQQYDEVEEIVRYFSQDGVQKDSTVFFENETQLPYSEISNIEAEITGYNRPDSDRMEINVRSNGDSYLAIAENYSLNWKAYVDGVETQIIRANHAFMAVEIGAGEHQIVIRYVPFWFWVGVVTGFAGLIFIIKFLL